MANRRTAPSQRSPATNVHASGDRKLDLEKILGVNVVRDRRGKEKLALTKAGARRLAKELGR
jgi:hypothetical protein